MTQHTTAETPDITAIEAKNRIDERLGYPNPQRVRKTWIDLNGQWDFYIPPASQSAADNAADNAETEAAGGAEAAGESGTVAAAASPAAASPADPTKSPT
ncbi:hypothetical protein, partial [Bifidobacterium simiarum]